MLLQLRSILSNLRSLVTRKMDPLINIERPTWKESKHYRSVNVCVGDTKDLELFGLTPLTNGWEEYYHISNTDLPIQVLLRDIGVFSSSSEAIRAGHKGPIPMGYTELKFKHFRFIYILRS